MGTGMIVGVLLLSDDAFLSQDKFQKQAVLSTATVLIDGAEKPFTQYAIDGYTYFKLRDLGRVLNFGVGWDAATKTIMISSFEEYTN